MGDGMSRTLNLAASAALLLVGGCNREPNHGQQRQSRFKKTATRKYSRAFRRTFAKIR